MNKKVMVRTEDKMKKAKGKKAATDLRGQGRSQAPAEGSKLGNEGKEPRSISGGTRSGASADDREVVPPAESETSAQAAHRRSREATAATDAEMDRLVAEREAERAQEAPPNPLFDLPEEERSKLFAWLRECPYDDAVRHILRDQGLGEVTGDQLSEFFQDEAENHWERRIERAALEANALVRLVENHPAKFSSGILAALGQEAFRQIASGQVAPEAMGKIATLFMKARSDERADQMQELKREKLRQEIEDQISLAMSQLADEVDRHPAARAAFEALQREMEECRKAKEDL